MLNRSWLSSVLVIVVLLTPSLRADQAYWLIHEVRGRWEYRVGDEAPRPLRGTYDPISPTGEIRCLETRLEACELRYLTTPRSMATRPLVVPGLQAGRWLSLKKLGRPPDAFLPVTSSELAARYAQVTRAGGSRAVSGCGGDFPLEAPKCGEVVDIGDFRIRWPGPANGSLAILVERVDGEPMLFRGSASADGGEFVDEGLAAFLKRVQSPAKAVDITVRVLADGGRHAVRLVRVPSAVDSEAFAARMRDVGPAMRAPVIVTRMMMALEEGMWSRAAQEATRLMTVAGRSVALLEYAVVGLCPSDFENAKSQLRKVVPARRFAALCDDSSVVSATPPAIASPAAPAQSTGATAESPAPASETTEPTAIPRARPGIALLIGNSDYWDMPLNSVKADIEGMSTTLESLGFVVHVKSNLRSPRHFLEALDEVLRREAATPEDVLLVYYSGHGLQLDGKAHLLSTGVSARARVAEDLRDNAQSAEELLAHMERAIPGTRIFIIEACRDNVLSSPAGEAQSVRGGFAFQQDDVPNTFVMFANRPGHPAAVRSDYGLMGPFTEALVHALQHSTGDLLEVFDLAAGKAVEISPSQQPVLYRSKSVANMVLATPDRSRQNDRARRLLKNAEAAYHARAWEELRATVVRAKALASDPVVANRLARETDFADLVLAAEAAEARHDWQQASDTWRRAHALFAVREWVAMRAAVAALLADDLVGAVRVLALLGAQSNSDAASRARSMLDELARAFPSLAAEVPDPSTSVRQVTGPEFEPLQDED